MNYQMLHENLCITLLLFHFCSVSQFQFLFTKSFGGSAWSLQVPGLGFGLSFTCWTSCVACEGWHGATDCQRASSRVRQGWEVEVGSLRNIWLRSSKSVFMFHLLDVASIVTVIWIMCLAIPKKCVFFAGIHWPQRRDAPSCVLHFVILTGCKRSFKSAQMNLPQL